MQNDVPTGFFAVSLWLDSSKLDYLPIYGKYYLSHLDFERSVLSIYIIRIFIETHSVSKYLRHPFLR